MRCIWVRHARVRFRLSQVRVTVNQCGDVICDSVWIVVGYWWCYEVY